MRADAIDADVLAHVWNYGTRPATTTLTLSRDNTEVARQALTIAPRAGATVTAVLRGGAGVVTGRIDTDAEAEDAIAGDNTRATDVAAPLAIRVDAGGVSGFLEQALRTRPGVTVVHPVLNVGKPRNTCTPTSLSSTKLSTRVSRSMSTSTC